MKPPALNRKLELQERVNVADGAGGYAVMWTTLGTLWAEVKPVSGREVAGTEVSLSAVSYVITLRATQASSAQRPLAGQHLVEGSRRFEILAVAEVGAEGRHLRCYAREETHP